jgi:hypothetical protein
MARRMDKERVSRDISMQPKGSFANYAQVERQLQKEMMGGLQREISRIQAEMGGKPSNVTPHIIPQVTASIDISSGQGHGANDAEIRQLRAQLVEMQQRQAAEGEALSEIEKQGAETKRLVADMLKSAAKKTGRGILGVTTATAAASGALAGAAAGGYRRFRDAFQGAGAEDLRKIKGGTLWIIIFFVIALLDVVGGYVYSGFKSPYSGFYFPVEQLKLTYFFGVVTSTFFLGLLLSKILFSVFEKRFSVFPYMAYVVLIYWLNNFALFSIGDKWYWVNAAAILALIILMSRGRNSQVSFLTIDDIAYFLYAFILTILLNNAITWFSQGDWLPFIHLSFILFFFYSFYRPLEEEDSTFYLLLSTVLFADFFGTNLLQSYSLIQHIPILFLMTTWIIARKTQNWTAAIILFIFLILSIGFASADYKQAFGEQLKLTKDTTTKTLSQRIDGISNALSSFFKSRIEYATQFSGQVEQNQYESLGVYFSDIKAAQPRFYNDEPVIIWGAIRSKTYQDAVAVTTSCYWKKDEKTKTMGMMKPDKPFLVFQLDETDVECTFPNKPSPQFSPGSYPITLAAEYNFITNAYQKVYFMDKDRYRNYIREGLDPLEEFGIKDKNPATVFTNGPVEIGMKVDPLIPIDQYDNYQVLPSIYITLSNRKEITDKDKKIVSRWEGKVQNITQLIILTPPGITINNNGADCQPISFKRVTEEECKASCTEGANSEKQRCERTCQHVKEPTKCIEQNCKEIVDKCVEVCSFIFKEDGTGRRYEAFALDISAIPWNYVSYFKDIDKFKTYSCKVQPTKDALETTTPITTRYFRIMAKYNYLLENVVPIVIEQSPVLAQATSPPTLQFQATLPNNQASLSWTISPTTEQQKGIHSYGVARYEGVSMVPISTCQTSTLRKNTYACTDPELLTGGKTYRYRLFAADVEGNTLLQEEKSLTAAP